MLKCLSLKLILQPQPYVGEVWHYKVVIRRTINGFNWQRTFLSTNVNEKVDIFNSTILNILSNFIPHKFVVFDDKDPPLFNKKTDSRKKKCCV